MMPLLALENITKHFQSGDTTVKALDGVSLAIYPGDFVAIMGQSGSGKSTLMNIIGCLDKPSSGSYRVRGKEASELEPDELATLRRETFGFVFQRYNLLATDTAAENVQIPAIYAGLNKEERVARSEKLLARLGLGQRSDHRPNQLSGGQQQRVAIARALMNEPPLILADEPTGALDSRSGTEVLALLKELHQEGRTIILITHDEKVAQHAERVIHISDGRIVKETRNGPERVRTQQVMEPEVKGEASLYASMEEAIHMAMRALRVNLFRTALTLLGIVIGVAAVVTMLAIGDGSKQKVLDQISAMGTNLLLVRPGGPGLRGTGDIVTLIPEDGDAIAALPNVEGVLSARESRMTLRYGSTDYQTIVQGTTPAFPQVKEWPVKYGQFFTDRDLKGYAPVVVLGQTVVENLFGAGANPIGEYILLRNVPFLIIGVLEAKGASANGADQDDAALVPLTTGLIRLFGKPYLASITAKVRDVNKIEETQDAITDVLIQRHRVEDFRIRNMSSILDTATETQNTFTILLGAVAAISLLVGGIGVMNIMLVSVTERTREIGVRMATGARMRDILLQFNIEATVVCALGGFLGVVIGLVTGWVLKLTGMAVIFTVTPAVLAFSCAFATGVLFGYLPARKAARMDPVVALASE